MKFLKKLFGFGTPKTVVQNLLPVQSRDEIEALKARTVIAHDKSIHELEEDRKKAIEKLRNYSGEYSGSSFYNGSFITDDSVFNPLGLTSEDSTNEGIGLVSSAKYWLDSQGIADEETSRSINIQAVDSFDFGGGNFGGSGAGDSYDSTDSSSSYDSSPSSDY